VVHWRIMMLRCREMQRILASIEPIAQDGVPNDLKRNLISPKVILHEAHNLSLQVSSLRISRNGASSFNVASSAFEVAFKIFTARRKPTTVAPLGVVVMLRELIVRSVGCEYKAST